jgi:hypothetical protein
LSATATISGAAAGDGDELAEGEGPVAAGGLAGAVDEAAGRALPLVHAVSTSSEQLIIRRRTAAP